MKGTFTSRGSIPVFALAGVMAPVGVGYAAIPSADGVIHSSYNASANPSGQLRIIDTGPQGPKDPTDLGAGRDRRWLDLPRFRGVRLLLSVGLLADLHERLERAWSRIRPEASQMLNRGRAQRDASRQAPEHSH